MRFLTVLGELAYGQAVEDYDQALTELVEAVNATKKKGTIQITLTLDPAQGESKQVTITDQVKVRKPEPDRMVTIMFEQRDGSLGRKDPRQPELPFKQASEQITDSEDPAVNE